MKILANFPEKIIDYYEAEEGKIPIFEIVYKEKKILVYRSRVGAPAAVMQFEEMISKGLKKLMLIGSCGVLDHQIGLGDIIIPYAGVRDEGTSYHYMPASTEVEADKNVIKSMMETMVQTNYPFTCTKTWTTDAIYRETKDKMQRRKEQGCQVVDMEFTAMQAVAKFRNIKFGQFFYSEDNLDSVRWEMRGSVSEACEDREGFLTIGLECAINL